MKIEFKNIDLTGISLTEQYKKIEEEEQEFKESLKKCNWDNENKCYYLDIGHVIEEFYDTIQAKLGLLEMFGIPAKEVMEQYPKHLKKLEKRGNKPRIKQCSKCIIQSKCKLYCTEHWEGQKEAESCRAYDDGERYGL